MAMIDEQSVNETINSSFEVADTNNDGFLNETELAYF